jgi:glutamyl-tRNA synthetase
LMATGQDTLDGLQKDGLKRAMYCLKERSKTFQQLIDKAYFILTKRPIIPDETAAAMLDAVSRRILSELTPQLQNASWNRETLEAVVASVAEANDTKLGKLAAPLRAALAGRSVSPSVFDMMLVLGREETLARLKDVQG